MWIHDKTNIKLSENQNLEIPSILFNFSNISELVNFEDNTIIDVIGIINSAAEWRTITTKTGGIKKVKEFIIVDNSIFNTDVSNLKILQNSLFILINHSLDTNKRK